MATVSEGMGLKESNTLSVFTRQLMLLLAQALRNKKRGKYMDEHMKGAKALLKHIKKGGQVNMQMVPAEDAELFAKILKNQRVPFVIVGEKDGKAIFATRDCDNKILEQVWDIYADEIKVGFKEMTPHEFINTHAEQEVCQSTGYSEIELEVFRKEAAKVGFNYAVVGNADEKGKYDILYAQNDADKAEKAFKGMAYEMSGPDGKEYAQELQKSLDTKKDIMARSKGKKEIYIASQNNPNKFAVIRDGVLTEHTLTIEEKVGRDGKKKQVVKDKTKRTNPFGNRELSKLMNSYGKCAELPMEAFGFIAGFDSAGGAIISDVEALPKALDQISDRVKTAEHIYNPYAGRKNSVYFDKIRTLSNLEPVEFAEITKALEKEGITYTAVNGDLAYLESDKKTVDKILNETLYKYKDFTTKFNDKVYLEGRGPVGFNLNNLSEPTYMMSVQNPDYVIKMDDNGITVLDKGKETLKIDKKSLDFESKREMLLGSMDDFAIVTKSELEAAGDMKSTLIEERAAAKDNDASYQYYKDYKQKKQEFIDTNVSEMNLTDKEIAKTYLDHEIKVTYVDRTLSEKIIDMDFGKKMQETRETTKRTEVER